VLLLLSDPRRCVASYAYDYAYYRYDNGQRCRGGRGKGDVGVAVHDRRDKANRKTKGDYGEHETALQAFFRRIPCRPLFKKGVQAYDCPLKKIIAGVNGMHEKRRALRYVPGQSVEIHLCCGMKEYTSSLSDVSPGGLMTLVPESEAKHLKTGSTVFGEIHLPDGPHAWEGQVVHHSPTLRGISLGVSAKGSQGAMRAAAEWLAGDENSGALRIHRSPECVRLEVIGRLSYELARDFLFLVRQSDVSRIDLSRCTSLDSSGLGMLSIAREMHMPIAGASGMVATLIDIARIGETSRA